MGVWGRIPASGHGNVRVQFQHQQRLVYLPWCCGFTAPPTLPALLQVHSHGYDRLAEKKGHEPDRCLPAGQDALVGRGTQGSDVSLYR